MALFSYRALDERETLQKGCIESESLTLAQATLSSQKWKILSLKKTQNPLFQKNLTEQDLLHFSLQLSLLLRSGVVLHDALQMIKPLFCKRPCHHVLLSLCEEIRGGDLLSNSLKRYPQSFPPFYCAMISIGEKSGQLTEVFAKLQLLLEKKMKIRKKLFSSLSYPLFLLSFSLFTFFFLMISIIPQIEELFGGHRPSLFTKIIFSASSLVRHHPIFLSSTILLGILSVLSFLKSKRGRQITDSSILHLPLIKQLSIPAHLISFSQLLALLLEGGVSLIEAIGVVREFFSNHIIREHLLRAAHLIKRGKSFHESVQSSSWMPEMVPQLLAVGEEGGNLSSILHKISEMYEVDFHKNVETVTSLAAPIILVILGLGIGTMMMGILTPLMEVNQFYGT